MNRCPTRDMLERYARGLIDDSQAADVEAHAATCRSCAKTLGRIDVNDDLIRELRAAEACFRETEHIVSAVTRTVSALTRTRLSAP